MKLVPGKFNADPTKDFFIHMLTRDIPLERAIIDLIDNSVDGAKNVLTKTGKDFNSLNAYDEFEIRINFNTNMFEIQDNCGGFNKIAANEYAFKFGRPKEKNGDGKGNVGRFGVGMKRALFKIGKYFSVESKSEEDHFIVEEDVDVWSEEPGTWQFDFKDIDDSKEDVLKDNGTLIRIRNLNEAVKQDFSLAAFQKKMIDEIERTLNYSIERGLSIFVNSVKLKSSPIELLLSEELKPYFFEEDIDDVNIRIYAGIGAPNPNMAGWYIYCNDRLMVDKDKTNLTGWEGGKNFYDDSGVQKYHNKVAMFRGLVFFTSDKSSSLPMTTTKWGIDVNSTIYKTTRNKMILAMKSVLDDLNRLNTAEERKQIVESSKLVDIVRYDKGDLHEEFVFPEIKKKDFEDDTSAVSYRVKTDILDKVKKETGVRTNGDAGKATFDYFVNMKEL